MRVETLIRDLVDQLQLLDAVEDVEGFKLAGVIC